MSLFFCLRFFCLTHVSGWVVMKPLGYSAAGEVYGGLVAKAMGIVCPDFRVPEMEANQVHTALFNVIFLPMTL